MTNKELAVQLYVASLKANAVMVASPNYSGGSVQIPTIDTMVATVAELTQKLSVIESD